jgi:hypothetical protein
MGPQSEGGPSGDGHNYGGQYQDDGRRYQSDRDTLMQDYTSHGHADDSRWHESDRDTNMQDDHLPPPNGAFGTDNRMSASPVGSASGRDREGDYHKTSGERNRSRTRSSRTASGQVRICKKCGEPLTGQFVRALGGTYHLDCFRCRVCISCCGGTCHVVH